jgi:hypothetical protein
VSLHPSLVTPMLDDGTFPVIDDLMARHAPEPSFLTFSAVGVAEVLNGYGRTVLADRSAFSDPFTGERPQGMEVRVAGPDDLMAFPPNRFGFIHLRWMPLGPNVLMNALRWLRPGGVLMVEAPDPYPALNMVRGPYQAVASAAVERMGLVSAAGLPVNLFRLGLRHVGCRYSTPDVKASMTLLTELVKEGGQWPDLLDADVRDWPHDPEAEVPFLANVMAWGVKPQ